ncbi:MAG: DUF1801 domain-containing protein [Gemmatimonadales bacterium]
MTPAEYIASLPPERRREITVVSTMINRHIPVGYREEFSSGMLCWSVPLSRLPDTYNGHPLWYVALASEKSYCSLHLMSCYADPGQLAALTAAFAAEEKKLDMGKACVHFQRADDLPLPAIGKLIAAVPLERWIEVYRKSRERTTTGRARTARPR